MFVAVIPGGQPGKPGLDEGSRRNRLYDYSNTALHLMDFRIQNARILRFGLRPLRMMKGGCIEAGLAFVFINPGVSCARTMTGGPFTL